MTSNWLLILSLIPAVIIAVAKVKDKFVYLILALQIVAVLLSFFSKSSLGFYILGATSILALFYALRNATSSQSKLKAILFFLPLILVFLFSSLSLPGANILRLLMIVPVVIFILTLFKIKKSYKAISYMLMFTVFAIIELVQLLQANFS